MSGGVYKIHNRTNGKCYVGRAERFEVRFKRHRCDLRRGKHHCLPLQRAWNRYGEAAFEFLPMVECGLEEAMRIEEQWLGSGELVLYNVSRRSCGGDLLSNHPAREEITARRNAAARVRMAQLTVEERAQRYGLKGERNGMYGRHHTAASRARMSVTTLSRVKHGAEHYLFGIRRSAETRAKISAVAAARTGAKNPFYGRTHRPETREKLAATRRGSLPTNCRAVLADGVPYISVTEAARRLGVTPPFLRQRTNVIENHLWSALNTIFPAIRAPVSV